MLFQIGWVLYLPTGYSDHKNQNFSLQGAKLKD
jgi:hypothetical protein